MSFRSKTIIGIALIEAVILIVLVWSSINYLARSSEEELAIRAQSVSETFANLIRDAVLATDLALLDSIARQALRSPELVYVRFTDGERILAQAGAERHLQQSFHADSGLADVDDGVFDYGVDIVHGETVFGRVELGMSVDRAISLIADAERHLVGIALVELFLVALFSYVLGAYLTRGLHNLTRAANAITDGAVGTTVEVKGRDELALAASAFNAMSTRLAESHRKTQKSIAESRRLSVEIDEQRLRLSTILNTAVDGIITTDEHGAIESINPAAAKLFGFGAAELVGDNISRLIVTPDPDSPGDRRQAFGGVAIAKILGDGREAIGISKTGETIPIDLSVSEMQINGRHMFVGLVRDISERKRIENEARRNEAIKSAIVDASLDALITIDGRGRIVDFSTAAEELFGYRRDRVLGRSMIDLLLPAELRDAYRRGILQPKLDGTDFIFGKRVEISALRRDGVSFPVELTMQPIKTDHDLMFAAFIRDISDRKRAEDELRSSKIEAEAASHAKSRFLAHMSHEIRSPLNAVLVSIGLLLDSDLDKDQRLFAKTARASGNSLLGLINDILDFSKIEAGQLTLEAQPFRLSDMIAETLDITALRITGKDLQSLVLIDPRIPQYLVGDKLRLRQILINLLDNATKFTDTGALVLELHQLERRQRESVIRFTIKDTGIGISRRDQEKLFQEFQQADDSDSTKYGGTGLGLSICRALCSAMGGSIRLSSEPGRGTCFEVDIPVAHDSDSPRSTETVTSSTRTLFVGFHDLIQQSLEDYSRTHEYPIDLAVSAEQAIDLMQRRPDIVLVDGSMPPAEISRLADRSREYGIKYRVLVAHRTGPEVAQWVQTGAFDDLHIMPVLINFADDLLQSRSGDVIDELNVTQEMSIIEASSGSPARVSKGRILLAEDSPANQAVFVALLEQAGYEVDVAENGRQAVDAFVKQEYDLILMDLRMPLMNGLEATKAIRELAGGESIPIVALTANASKEDVDRCLNSGMEDFVAKPADKKKLIAVLEKYIPPAGTTAGDVGTDTLTLESLSVAGEAAASQAPPVLDETVFRQLAEDTSPELVPQMVDLFIEEMGDRGTRLIAGRATLPMASLQDEAHTIKSCAGAFGARKLQETAKAMESACIAEDRATVELLAATLEQDLQQTLQVYREKTQGG